MIVSFCGHADYVPSPTDRKRVLDFLEALTKEEKISFFLGGYGGFDRFAAACAKAYRAKHDGATLVLILPYLPTERRANYPDGYDMTLYPPLEHVPPRYAISHRNRWIVDQADVIIAYVTRSWGGAHAMLQYATKKGKPVFDLTQ